MLFKQLVQALAVSTAVTSVVARPVAHLHHQHAKRDVVVVTETVVVVVGGDSSKSSTLQYVHAEPTSTASQSTTAVAQVVPTTTSSYSSDDDEESSTTSPTTSSTSTKAKETTTSSSSSTSEKETETSSVSSGGAKGITYSPYTSTGACKSLSEVQSDFESLTGFDLIRLYGVDCNQVENVLQAKSDDQKLFLGVYYVDAIADAVSTISDAVSSYGSWDDIDTVSIGNELVNGGASVSEVTSYVKQGRSALKEAGYTGSVVTVDTHVAIIANPDLCELSDYIAFNAHSYWDGTIYPEGAGAWLVLQMQRVWTACGGEKKVVCTESGWPSQGNANGVAVPSEKNQKTAIDSLKSACGDDTILFTAFDDLWKNPGSQGVEQYWGIL